MVDAVVFDLDGVIVDSEPVWEEVRRAYVAEHGGTWQADTQRRLMGMSTGEWSRYLSAELGVGRSPEQVATEVVEEMTRRYAARVPVIDDAPAVVRRLAGRWPLGLASSSPTRLIAAALAATGLTDQFRATLSTEETERGKPAPDVYLAVARRLGVDPARCVAVEDSSNGVRSAAAAGMAVVAIPHGAYPLDDDAAELAAVVLGSVDELTTETVDRLG
ncbi:haloacid dehalogenase superfamily, subfamily IA, variant 3 with third motif having DD or ED [Micromonospora echinaurantiaca]|uniref:Haloacid dehalogenase superfamily, subfamily IA, variant 3 with third motif having DD or ED n=1 Tax=Micromonospora echinaurantiaca TaxID=47857 RepID=A0A1C5KBU1_9ACTN|nr:HAD family phosphatase [Micromonospora echinaurantiaca]SCG80252.1 haloacid dehalogenase superfamily, subfamily IA, variant 3 with third motif having DD or ED [Micromonospora echinaurantiaca]